MALHIQWMFQLGALLVLTFVAKTEAACPDNWEEFEGRCYLFVLNTDVSWSEANRRCRAEPALPSSLVSIHSFTENDFIHSTAAQQVGDSIDMWIGFHRTEAGDYQWTDETPVDFVNWDIAHPVGEDCVDIRLGNGHWTDLDCDVSERQHGFVCSAELDNNLDSPVLSVWDTFLRGWGHRALQSEAAPQPRQTCPGGEWMEFNGRCFLFKVEQTTDHKTWDEAMGACRMFNGGRASLVSIHSKEENKFIWDNAVDKMNGKMHVWIGMKKTALGYPYVWEDDSSVDYVNWDANEPNDADGSQPCCRLYEFNGKWDDFDCTGRQEWEEYHGYICQADAVAQSDAQCLSVPDAPYPGCCAAGDVFAIIFGLIILAGIVIGILGYLYFYRWDRRFPWQKSDAPTSFENPQYAK